MCAEQCGTKCACRCTRSPSSPPWHARSSSWVALKPTAAMVAPLVWVSTHPAVAACRATASSHPTVDRMHEAEHGTENFCTPAQTLCNRRANCISTEAMLSRLCGGA